jgi:hypothetical protein
MVPDSYTHEKLVLEHRHTLQREADHETGLTQTSEKEYPNKHACVGGSS